MSYQPSIHEFITGNKRKRDDEVLQLSDEPVDSFVNLSNEDDGDDTDKEKSNSEPLPNKKKRIALTEQFPWLKEVDCLYYCKVCSANSIAGSAPDRYFVMEYKRTSSLEGSANTTTKVTCMYSLLQPSVYIWAGQVNRRSTY